MENKFKQGDCVRVKDWDELVSKWAMRYEKIPDMAGPNVNGLYFNPEMRKYCGQVFTVIGPGKDYNLDYNLQDDNGNVLCCGKAPYFSWSFNDDMLDPVSDQIEPTVSFNELFAL